MNAFAEPVIAQRGSTDSHGPLVVLLHGRGSNEADIIGLANHLPGDAAYVAVRAPMERITASIRGLKSPIQFISNSV